LLTTVGAPCWRLMVSLICRVNWSSPLVSSSLSPPGDERGRRPAYRPGGYQTDRGRWIAC